MKDKFQCGQPSILLGQTQVAVTPSSLLVVTDIEPVTYKSERNRIGMPRNKPKGCQMPNAKYPISYVSTANKAF